VPVFAGKPLDAETFVQGLRALQHWIPGFVQLSNSESQSMLRAASLDPEVIAAGIATAHAWTATETRRIFGFTGEDLDAQRAESVLWDEAERELRVLLKGVAAANLTRRYRLGSAILRIYGLLRVTIENADRVHLRAYFEEMKRAYQQKRKRKKSGE
jgi:hypothetical protein